MQRGEVEAGQTQERQTFGPRPAGAFDLTGVTLGAGLLKAPNEHLASIRRRFMALGAGGGRGRRHAQVGKMFLKVSHMVELQPGAALIGITGEFRMVRRETGELCLVADLALLVAQALEVSVLPAMFAMAGGTGQPGGRAHRMRGRQRDRARTCRPLLGAGDIEEFRDGHAVG